MSRGLPTGHVYTAMGDVLDFEDLVAKSRRPLGGTKKNNEIKQRAVPKRGPMNVRGNRPASGVSPTSVAAANAVVPKTVAAERAVEETRTVPTGLEDKSIADLTAVKLEKPARLRNKVPDLAEHSAKELGKVLGGLAKSTNDPTGHDGDWQGEPKV